MEKNLTKSQLIDLISQDSGLPKVETELILEATINRITESLIKGDRIQLYGFGSFETKRRASRQGRNPKTGENIDIPEKTVPVFKPGKQLRELVNKEKQVSTKKKLLDRLKEKLLRSR
ncbi:MAG: HU family DNA-binding protein [bacterium]